jgi:dolichyl-phosphate beta-glucosyltransferase
MNAPRAPRVRLVVPCYNEAQRLRPDVFLEFVGAHDAVAILFVDDGSTDATPRLLSELAGRAAGRIAVAVIPRNAGKAAAVQHGMREALRQASDYVGYWDCDLATPLEALPAFVALLDSHPRLDIVIGSRVKLLGRRINRHVWRHYIGRVFATGASLALGLAVYDTQCGAKLFRACEAVARAFEKPFRSAWVFDVEVLARYLAEVGSAEAESRIYELPLDAWTDVPGSKVKVRDASRALWDLVRIWLTRRAGPRP